MSERTRLRFRLWVAANGLAIVPLGLILLPMATGIGAEGVDDVLLPLLLILLVASGAFRFSYNRSIPAGSPMAGDPPAEAA